MSKETQDGSQFIKLFSGSDKAQISTESIEEVLNRAVIPEKDIDFVVDKWIKDDSELLRLEDDGVAAIWKYVDKYKYTDVGNKIKELGDIQRSKKIKSDLVINGNIAIKGSDFLSKVRKIKVFYSNHPRQKHNIVDDDTFDVLKRDILEKSRINDFKKVLGLANIVLSMFDLKNNKEELQYLIKVIHLGINSQEGVDRPTDEEYQSFIQTVVDSSNNKEGLKTELLKGWRNPKRSYNIIEMINKAIVQNNLKSNTEDITGVDVKPAAEYNVAPAVPKRLSSSARPTRPERPLLPPIKDIASKDKSHEPVADDLKKDQSRSKSFFAKMFSRIGGIVKFLISNKKAIDIISNKLPRSYNSRDSQKEMPNVPGKTPSQASATQVEQQTKNRTQ